MYFVRTLRSPVRSGRLLSIDCPVLPEGYCLIRAKDIPGRNVLAGAFAGPDTDFNPAFSHPILAETEILYEGQPAALLVGPDEAEIAKLEDSILVNCVDAGEAGETDAPLRVYAERNITVETDAKAAKSSHAAKAAGDIYDGEDTPPRQVRLIETYHTTPDAEHNAPECTGAVAFFEGARCVIHTASQWPRHVRRSAAGMLNIDEAHVEIMREPPGVHFDAKVWYPSLIAAQAALAAFITKKPVKFMLSREEERRYSPRRAASEIQIRSALDEEGRIVETGIDIEADLGACGFFADEIIDQMALASLGLYRLGTVTLRARAVGTASVPKGAFSGFGMAQGFFAIERHITRVVDEARVSPLEWKLERAIVKQGGGPVKLPIGIMLQKPLSLHAVINKVCAQTDFARKWAAYDLSRRRGYAWEYARERVQEHVQEYPDECLEHLIVDKLSPVRGIGLAVAYQGTGLLYRTGGDPLSEPNVSLLPLPDKEAAMSEIRYQSDPVQNWAGRTCDQKTFSHPALCAAVIEVEIEKVEYKPQVRCIRLCVEGGKILSVQDARNTLTICGIAALAWAQGKREVPNIKDVPNIEIDFIPSGSDRVCGLEELAFSTIPAAYASAVSQALNISFDSLPIRPVEIWRALRPESGENGEKGGNGKEGEA
ncbi:MAG: molybdopterin-dependent oxidoreductase [Spirochaetaceae bacterium]|jgi:CO/xanthine dehydrogenase Mo-binding subunit|nr:molybdopterin-dependent oxidoreductase [Spirochaetaceae bacterium]